MNSVMKSKQAKVSHHTFDTRGFYPARSADWNNHSFFTMGCTNRFQSRIECCKFVTFVTLVGCVRKNELPVLVRQVKSVVQFALARKDEELMGNSPHSEATIRNPLTNSAAKREPCHD